MRKTIVAMMILAVVTASCSKETLFGEGPVVTETRAISNFHGVSTGVPGKINFTIDPVYKVEIKAQQNIIDAMLTNVVNGILDIDFRHDVRVREHENITINISAPSADFFRLSGSGDIAAEGNLVSQNLVLELSGSGSIMVDKATVADKINARISGSGNMSVLNGSAKNEELRISGSGNMNLADVAAERAEVNISGSGDMRVNLSQALSAKISGSGSIYYKGNPSISSQVSGSGTIRPL